MVPIIIICYNNYKYVDNTIKQIKKINESYVKFIKIVDNVSTDIETITYLKNINVDVIYNTENTGPWISQWDNVHIYDTLPDKFILTDPDLEFNINLPSNFIEIMIELSDIYNCNKIGFALKIDDFDKMYQCEYAGTLKIAEYEDKFWLYKIDNIDFELYNAEIDTTFYLCNKNGNYDLNIRMAGNFIARHLPWYVDNEILNIYEKYIMYSNQTQISTIAKYILSHIDENYLKINKCDEYFFIKKNENDKNLSFWRDIFSYWENETFDIFNKYLQKDKIFIDIGGWIGTTCIYGSLKSKHVYVIEADALSVIDLTNNCNINSHNITVINNAIYYNDNIDICFGKNKFLNNAELNDSTSHIYENYNLNFNDYYTVKTITIQSILTKYNIDPSNVSLIKVDIEGGEELILEDLYFINKNYKIPLYVSFHYTWWINKDLNRFTFLTEEQKNLIIKTPFTSLLLDY